MIVPSESFKPGQRLKGFTLVELVIVITLIGILSAVSVIFILPPFEAAVDLENRARLVNATDSALNGISRDVRNALPNSVRVFGNIQLEFISTRTGSRYRRLQEPGGTGDPLVIARPADSFDVLGPLPGAAEVVPASAGAACATGNGDCISIYNTSQAGFDAYSGDNIAPITSVAASSVSYDTGGIGPAFSAHSPRQRFFVVDEVVSYVCDLGSGRLVRFFNYGLSTPPTLSDGSTELVASDVSGCRFQYQPGTSTRRGLLLIELEITRAGESVTLLKQVQVLNAP